MLGFFETKQDSVPRRLRAAIRRSRHSWTVYTPAEKSKNQAIASGLTDLEKASLALLNVGTRSERAKICRNPGAIQIYIDQVQKKAGLSFGFDFRTERPQTSEEIRQVQIPLQRTYNEFVSYSNMPPNTGTRDSYLDQ